MHKKRTHLKIIYDMLEVIRSKQGWIKPTHILYKSNLSYQMMQEYLNELLSKGFIAEGSGKQGKTYAITEKGLKFLEKYALIKEFTASFGLEE